MACGVGRTMSLCVRRAKRSRGCSVRVSILMDLCFLGGMKSVKLNLLLNRNLGSIFESCRGPR